MPIKKVVVIEKEHFELSLIERWLERRFPGVTICSFDKAGEFLMSLGEVSDADLIITEHYLALAEVREDLEEWLKTLSSSFPTVVDNWNHQKAAEVLISLLRERGCNTPIIIYTHSEKEWIAEEVLSTPRVHYLGKDIDDSLLLSLVEEVVDLKSPV